MAFRYTSYTLFSEKLARHAILNPIKPQARKSDKAILSSQPRRCFYALRP